MARLPSLLQGKTEGVLFLRSQSCVVTLGMFLDTGWTGELSHAPIGKSLVKVTPALLHSTTHDLWTHWPLIYTLTTQRVVRDPQPQQHPRAH